MHHQLCTLSSRLEIRSIVDRLQRLAYNALVAEREIWKATQVQPGTERELSELNFHVLDLNTFHCIYLFQFVLVGHFVWRCQWRRIPLSRFKSHVPGDKAFKSKVCSHA